MTVKVIMPFIGDHFIGKEIIYFIKIAEMSEGYLSEFAVIGQEAPLLRALYNSFFHVCDPFVGDAQSSCHVERFAGEKCPVYLKPSQILGSCRSQK